jgi:RimJ/RimL family protein N-acetyltransferase
MQIATARLRLDCHRPEDAHRLHRWRNDPEIVSLSADTPLAETSLEDAQKRIEAWNRESDTQKNFAIFLRSSNEYIGFCHVALIDLYNRNCRIGIVIGDREHWGRGYGTEVMRGLSQFCFHDLALHRITCETYSHNRRAWRMLEAAGFAREGVLREQVRRGDAWRDEYLYGLLSSDGGR